MSGQKWSRRDVIKSAATGTLALGAGAVAYNRMSRYIVGVRSDAGVTAAASVSDTSPFRVDLTEHTPWQLVSGTFSEARTESLNSRDDVGFVQPDWQLETLSAQTGGTEQGQTIPWGVDRIGAATLRDAGETAADIDIGIIDGGIDASHPDIKPNVAPPSNDAAHKAWVNCSGGACTYPWSDDGGHGTHVAGTAAATDRPTGTLGVAPDATLHALKVCDGSGRCRSSAVVKAIQYAAEQDWDVVNLSLGSGRPSTALQAAGEYALEAGVVPVAAAGNQGRAGSVNYPAAYDEFIGVSATTIDDAIAGFSSRGGGVDLAAPGENICAPGLDGYETNSGTSMAAPHVAGAVAHTLADGVAPTEVRNHLRETAEDIDLSESEQGAGLVDAAAALGYSHDGGTGDGVRCPSPASV
jgi:subtilisin